jgi:ABC-type branched-subunit amino acid transport system ATPase component
VREAYLGAGGQAERGRQRTLPVRDAPLLTVRSLSAGYGAATVVRDAALEVGDGELVAVLGANGAGKTTLLRALSGLIRPMAGEVRVLGWRIDQLAGDRIAREGLILVPEGRQVFPDLSVIDNLRLGAYARGSAGEARRIEALLERFAALEARRHQRAGLLSGGEQQMLAIARGLMARPEVLMLDEPSLGLAPKLLEVLYDLLAELREEELITNSIPSPTCFHCLKEASLLRWLRTSASTACISRSCSLRTQFSTAAIGIARARRPASSLNIVKVTFGDHAEATAYVISRTSIADICCASAAPPRRTVASARLLRGRRARRHQQSCRRR